MAIIKRRAALRVDAKLDRFKVWLAAADDM